MNDYEKALKLLEDMPKYHLGQEVNTPNGKGIIVELNMDHNGLYLVPHRSGVKVWYSNQRAVESDGWITNSYVLTQISAIQ